MISGDNHKTLNRTRIDVYETLCPQQMLVHKGGKIRNWGGVCRDVTPTKLQSQNIFKESTGGGGVVKIQKIYFFFGGGSGWGGQGRCEQRSKVFVKIKKKLWGGGEVRGGGRGQGGCE